MGAVSIVPEEAVAVKNSLRAAGVYSRDVEDYLDDWPVVHVGVPKPLKMVKHVVEVLAVTMFSFWPCPSVVRLVPFLAAVWILTGCGGDGGPAPTPDDRDEQVGDFGSAEIGTAHFRVDVETGSVTVTHSQASEDTIGPAAVFAGTALHFDSTLLYDQR
jgi:hypothetical protein